MDAVKVSLTESHSCADQGWLGTVVLRMMIPDQRGEKMAEYCWRGTLDSPPRVPYTVDTPHGAPFPQHT